MTALTRSSLLISPILILSGVLSGCSTSPPAVIAPGGPPQTRTARKSWIDPVAKAKALLYLSDEDDSVVRVYSYPDLAPKETLSGFLAPAGLCVNPQNGNVWITDSLKSEIFEFSHGGTTPIRTLQDGGDDPAACAVNPRNGDLAVANERTGDGSDPGDLVIFKHGHEARTTYQQPRLLSMNFLGYDDSGNLFVDALAYGSKGFRFYELPSSGTELLRVHWHGPHVRYPGNVQFDGTTIAVGDNRRGLVYRTEHGIVTGRTKLRGACFVNQFYIDGSTIIAPSFCKSVGTFSIYNYPAGGAPLKTIAGFTFPYGAAVSR